jgi:thiamine-monophosphate kinase
MAAGLEEIGEFGFIRRISHGCLVREKDVVKAIGDDAAAFIPAAGELTLVTTDLLVERVHFLRSATTGFNLGVKALAVNFSDIAAMGGTARNAFVSIAVPHGCGLDFLEDLYRGMRSMATRYAVNILGGDTTASRADLVINVAVTGSVPRQEMLCRDGARPGDWICCTGCLGDSRAGLHLILKNVAADTPELETLVQAHLLPRPCLAEGRFLAAGGAATAAIDVSDGLGADLGHLLEASGTGARIHADKLPLSDSLRSFCRRFEQDPLEFALAGGEDYTLLVTLSPDRAEAVAGRYRETFGRPLYVLGEMTDTGQLEIVTADGRHRPTAPGGWDHFKTGPDHGSS